MAENSVIIKKNCEDYAQSHGKAIDVLRNANGKNHYSDIARILNMPATRVSGLLKKASKLGLAQKNNSGHYKKATGILGYMPKIKGTIKPQKTVGDLLKKITQKKTKQRKYPHLSVSERINSTIEKMSDAYKLLYAVENILRDLIRKVFANQDNWWKNRIPSGIQTVVADTIKTTPYHAAKRKDELEYTHLGQLREIIICNKNWNDFISHLN